VTRNGKIAAAAVMPTGERSRFMDGSRLHVFCQTRLCHIRSDKHVSIQGRDVGVADSAMSSIKKESAFPFCESSMHVIVASIR
jgi:hypothetical protein